MRPLGCVGEEKSNDHKILSRNVCMVGKIYIVIKIKFPSFMKCYVPSVVERDAFVSKSTGCNLEQEADLFSLSAAKDWCFCWLVVNKIGGRNWKVEDGAGKGSNGAKIPCTLKLFLYPDFYSNQSITLPVRDANVRWPSYCFHSANVQRRLWKVMVRAITLEFGSGKDATHDLTVSHYHWNLCPL